MHSSTFLVSEIRFLFHRRKEWFCMDRGGEIFWYNIFNGRFLIHSRHSNHPASYVTAAWRYVFPYSAVSYLLYHLSTVSSQISLVSAKNEPRFLNSIFLVKETRTVLFFPSHFYSVVPCTTPVSRFLILRSTWHATNVRGLYATPHHVRGTRPRWAREWTGCVSVKSYHWSYGGAETDQYSRDMCLPRTPTGYSGRCRNSLYTTPVSLIHDIAFHTTPRHVRDKRPR